MDKTRPKQNQKSEPWAFNPGIEVRIANQSKHRCISLTRLLTQRRLPTPNPQNCLLAAKLSTEGQQHLTRETQRMVPGKHGQGSCLDSPTGSQYCEGPTNHSQKVHLDLPPGWLAIFVPKLGSFCPSIAAKMPRH